MGLRLFNEGRIHLTGKAKSTVKKVFGFGSKSKGNILFTCRYLVIFSLDSFHCSPLSIRAVIIRGMTFYSWLNN